MTVLELDHVTYPIPARRAPALDDVTLEIEPGELVVVAGASGSGKSTLLRAASGLVPHFHGGDVRRAGDGRRDGHARARTGRAGRAPWARCSRTPRRRS